MCVKAWRTCRAEVNGWKWTQRAEERGGGCEGRGANVILKWQIIAKLHMQEGRPKHPHTSKHRLVELLQWSWFSLKNTCEYYYYYYIICISIWCHIWVKILLLFSHMITTVCVTPATHHGPCYFCLWKRAETWIKVGGSIPDPWAGGCCPAVLDVKDGWSSSCLSHHGDRKLVGVIITVPLMGSQRDVRPTAAV